MNDKLKMESMDMAQFNIEQIVQLLPQVVTEVADPNGAIGSDGKPLLKKAIDFEKLKLILSAGSGDYVVADDEFEKYEFTWVGKRQAMIDASTPIRKTLRPCKKESKNWEATENLYIEGDNLEVLKLLQESYLGKVKMIYIDPPYNTGKDFVYKDNFKQGVDEYNENSGMYDEEGNRLFQNTESNGRFHSDWCSMIYSRLLLARNLLSDDGVIFISIDDNEVENLKKVCDEVFGIASFITTFIWKRRQNVDSRSKNGASIDHEYALAYSRSMGGKIRGAEKDMSKYSNPDNDPRGNWMSADMTGLATKAQRPNLHYDLINPKTNINYGCPVTGWRYEPKRMRELIDNDEVLFPQKIDGRPRRKKFQSSLESEFTGKSSLLLTAFNTQATREVREIFDNEDYFDFPKPIDLLKEYIVQGTTQQDSIILDFFSGSATTAHAVMQLNAEDGGNRKFIMVQLPEETDEKSDAYKAGYKNICEIGKERIRRAGEKIVGEQKPSKEDDLFSATEKKLDIGFRVFKVDETNMRDVYYSAGDIAQENLHGMLDNIKDDRSDLDLLYGCLLDWGVELTYPHSTEEIDGATVHTVDTPATDEIDLIACFDSNLPESVFRQIASRKPLRALFRDHCFADSSYKINVFEIFKALAPDTSVKVI